MAGHVNGAPDPELVAALKENNDLRCRLELLVQTEARNQRIISVMSGVYEAMAAIMWAADLENATLMRQAMPAIREAAEAVINYLDDMDFDLNP